MIIKRLKRTISGRKINPGKKLKRVFVNKSKFNHKYLRREEYLVEKDTGKKIIAISITDCQLNKKTRILKKNNIVSSSEGKFKIQRVNKNSPSLVVKL